MIRFAPTPTPVPTVTVTQTVLVPTSLPTPTINMPSDGVGWPTLMDGFLGATIATLVAGVAVIVTIILTVRTLKEAQAAQTAALQAAELARLDDQRVALADRLLEDIDGAYEGLLHSEHQALLRAVRRLIGWRTRFSGMYGHLPAHEHFTTWLHDEVRRTNDGLIPVGLAIDEGRSVSTETRRELLDALIVLEKSVVLWIARPEEWAPVELDPQTVEATAHEGSEAAGSV